MDVEVFDRQHEIYIEVRDDGPMRTQMLGHARTNLGFFAVPGGRKEWLELFYEGGVPAGKIHFRSEFFLAPVAVVEPIRPPIVEVRPPIVEVRPPIVEVMPPVVEVRPPVIVEPIRAPEVIVGGGLIGNLKLHLLSAHINHKDQYFERMNPYVLIRVNGREWRSEVCFEGGKNPSWTFQFMDIEVFNMEHEINIEVRD